MYWYRYFYLRIHLIPGNLVLKVSVKSGIGAALPETLFTGKHSRFSNHLP